MSKETELRDRIAKVLFERDQIRLEQRGYFKMRWEESDAKYLRPWRREAQAIVAELDGFIADVRADERRSLLEELTADAEHEARIGEQGNDSERVNAAEKIIEMLNDIQIEREA
ncbi:MAG: hypothetical protein ACTHZ6_16165 [Brevibacterium aurantiacum]|uniref:hypothetical protein n=1 Tax=Brevibacterium aurantiacum TaxID=273384 RepID=UPI003F9274DF